MSTSELPEEAAGRSAGASPDAWNAVKAEFPDPAVLARMANEFFTALPAFNRRDGDAAVTQSPPLAMSSASLENVSSVTQPEAPGAFGVTEAGLSALPSTLGVPAVSSFLAPISLAASVPAVPGDAGFGLFWRSVILFSRRSKAPLFRGFDASRNSGCTAGVYRKCCS